jgi:hypothetical protein
MKFLSSSPQTRAHSYYHAEGATVPSSKRRVVVHIPRSPFLGTWPRREKVSPKMAHSLLTIGNFLLQLFKPVQHDVDLRGGGSLFGRPNHQEPLTVRGHVIGCANQGPVGRKSTAPRRAYGACPQRNQALWRCPPPSSCCRCDKTVPSHCGFMPVPCHSPSRFATSHLDPDRAARIPRGARTHSKHRLASDHRGKTSLPLR